MNRNTGFLVLIVLALLLIFGSTFIAPVQSKVINENNFKIDGVYFLDSMGNPQLIPCSISWGRTTEKGLQFSDSFGRNYFVSRPSVAYNIVSALVRGEINACK